MGALLHDIGKIIFRAGIIDSKSHGISGKEFIEKYTQDKNILDCIRFHHKQDIKGAKIASDSVAYLVSIANSISSGHDMSYIEGENKSKERFEKKLPLESVFNRLNNNTGNQSYLPNTLDKKNGINYPQDIREIVKVQHSYNDIYEEFKKGLRTIVFEPEYINSILELCEANTSYIPSSIIKKQAVDISLFDHIKITAAIASCIYEYLIYSERTDFKNELLLKEKEFKKEKAFLMFSCDFSGIQQFIYTISSKGALKGLRARSFYLEIMLEHIVDELLTICGLSRVNLIYTGGGHAYILLPNTKDIIENINKANSSINQWFISKFGNALYLAIAYEECSANDLQNISEDKEAYQNIYRNLSSKLSQHKIRRYGADEIRRLNSLGNFSEGRECVVCGTADKLVKDKDDRDICETCNALQEISREIIKDNILIISSDKKISKKINLAVPSLKNTESYISTITENEAKQLIKAEKNSVLKIYSKNRLMTGMKFATKILMGDYCTKNVDGIASFEELAKKSKGIERIAVLE